MTKDQRKSLIAYLKQDRQWKRHHRLGFARLMLKYAKSETFKASHAAIAEAPQHSPAFWEAVIAANSR